MKPRDDARVFDMRTKKDWGDSIQWWKIEDRRVVGWCSPLPRVRDILKSEMASGRVGIFVFTEVEPQHNPGDMFFGTVEQIGYDEAIP